LNLLNQTPCNFKWTFCFSLYILHILLHSKYAGRFRIRFFRYMKDDGKKKEYWKY